MIDFAKNNRTTTYFRDYAIKQIRIAYRIMEYLAPDSVFSPRDLDEKTLNLMLSGFSDEAYERIDDEVIDMDLGSSSGEESLKAQACELITYLVSEYHKINTQKREQRRAELLKELNEL